MSNQPQTIEKVYGNYSVRHTMSLFLEQNRIPHLILWGPHGTSKRTFSRVLAAQYLGPHVETALFTIDGSIQRGKDIITATDPGASRNVIDFCRTRMSCLPTGTKRIVIIYNFEDMTEDAQDALRRVIEQNDKTTTFIFTANSLLNVIEPIQSRCFILKTERLTEEETMPIFQELAPTLDRANIDIVNILAEGDIKRIINLLTVINCAQEQGSIIDEKFFTRTFGIPSLVLMRKLLQGEGYQNYVLMQDLLSMYMLQDIVDMLCKVLNHTKEIPDERKIQLRTNIAKYMLELESENSHIKALSLVSILAAR